MKITGKVVVYNHDDISTDQIIPGPYGFIKDMKEMATHCLEGADPTLRQRFATVGHILVAGKNFGCGSSREYAVIVLQESGVEAVVIKSAARIWYRNSVNLGLPVIFCQTLPESVEEGEEIEIDLHSGKITEKRTEVVHQGEAPSAFVMDIYREGGIRPMMRRRAMNKAPVSTIRGTEDNGL
ncbi:MAG: 3-isopropylmalate dehydratase small subunit [Desulfopila sp.]